MHVAIQNYILSRPLRVYILKEPISRLGYHFLSTFLTFFSGRNKETVLRHINNLYNAFPLLPSLSTIWKYLLPIFSYSFSGWNMKKCWIWWLEYFIWNCWGLDGDVCNKLRQLSRRRKPSHCNKFCATWSASNYVMTFWYFSRDPKVKTILFNSKFFSFLQMSGILAGKKSMFIDTPGAVETGDLAEGIHKKIPSRDTIRQGFLVRFLSRRLKLETQYVI